MTISDSHHMTARILKYTLLLVFMFAIGIASQAEDVVLSGEAEISVVVADPGTAELFEVFGHPAIRVFDPVNRIDAAFNYGVFDFNQPNFYLNFTKGYLNYMLAVWPYPSFEASYISENRSLTEYVLNLSQQQKQEIFDFLMNNAKPENRHYYYDYFYDNCATRIWDVFDETLKDDLHFDSGYVETGHSFRTLVDSLTVNKPWGDFGIDLCLGLPMDKKLTSYEYMFLPEFLGRGIAKATIEIDGKTVPFTKEKRLIFQSGPKEINAGLFTPNTLFWSIFILALIVTIIEFFKSRNFNFLDILIFGVLGMIGLLLLVLWVATNHSAAADNLNIIWANPLYLIGVFYLLKKGKNPGWLSWFFLTNLIVMILLLIFWPLNPQGINVAVIPIILTLGIRSWYVRYRLRMN